MNTLKKCSKCCEYKPFDEFHNQKKCKDGKICNCKMCVKAYQKAHYTDEVKIKLKTYNKTEKYKAYQKAYRQKQKDKKK